MKVRVAFVMGQYPLFLSTSDGTTKKNPSPLAGEGKGEGESIEHPHLYPLPSRERRLSFTDALYSFILLQESGHILDQRIDKAFVINLFNPMQIPQRQRI